MKTKKIKWYLHSNHIKKIKAFIKKLLETSPMLPRHAEEIRKLTENLHLILLEKTLNRN